VVKIMALLGQYPPDELERRRQAMRAAASADTQVEFAQIEGSVYRGALTELHRTLAAPMVARQALAAEKAGYDAVVPYGTLDLGVEEARHVVRIPVVGPGRAGCHAAATLVERFGVICYDEPHIAMFDKLLRAWRVDRHVTSIRAVGIVITSMAQQRAELRTRFVERGRWLVREEGAQLLLPLGLTMVPVTFSAAELAAEIGVPVLDPLAISMRLAETLAVTGVTNSRVAYPAASLE
jgi:allantoin racemase